jgi:2-hydroxychromene-2-carboxylate isomerase
MLAVPLGTAALCALPDADLDEIADSTNFQLRTLDAGVFGAPSFVIDGEIFWGQDRLDFVARKLEISA